MGAVSKAARQQESSQLAHELAGMRSVCFLLFLVFLGFTARFSLLLANSLDTPWENQQLAAKLARDSAARNERLAKRNLELIASAAKMTEDERMQQVQLKLKQAKLDAEIPEWATPRSSKSSSQQLAPQQQQQQRKKPTFDVEFEETEKMGEEAEREIRLQMGSWLKELESALPSSAAATAESVTFQKLKKRQEFVDSVLDSVMDIPDLDFDLSVFRAEAEAAGAAAAATS